VTKGAISALINTALAGYASTTQLASTNQSVSDLAGAVGTGFVLIPSVWNAFSYPDGLRSYVEAKVGGYDLVHEPSDRASYPSGNFRILLTNLKTYSEEKVNDFKDAGSSYLKLRNTSGVTHLDFLRSSETFGSVPNADWKLTTNSNDGLDIVRKATPVLGLYENEKIVQFKDDGDVNVVKEGGLKVNNEEVATKDFTDSTYAQINLEQFVSDLSFRLASVEEEVATPTILDTAIG